MLKRRDARRNRTSFVNDYIKWMEELQALQEVFPFCEIEIEVDQIVYEAPDS